MPLARPFTVYNIEAGQCFADTLALGLLEKAADDPLALSACLVLLPNRRACRTLRDAFLRLSDGKASLLPRLSPLGETDADETALLATDREGAGAVLAIPPAIAPLERQMVLARLIMQTHGVETFDQAAALAEGLGQFLDEAHAEGLSFDGLKNLVPDIFAEHWQQTLKFLEVLTAHWPVILKERGVIDHAARQNLLLEARIRLWKQAPPAHAVIAAGSTGATPAVAELLRVVAGLPDGMVVLPGLDMRLDGESWELLPEDHPQYTLKALLERLKLPRQSVRPWEIKKKVTINRARAALISESMRPAKTAEKWRELTDVDVPPQALEKLSRIDCDTPEEEADVIALIMREVLETPGKTAALITPDRQLAQRVTLSLKRWGIAIDDSGGRPLSVERLGSWLTLTAEIVRDNLAPVALLSCLKHPLMALSMPAEDLRELTYLLDRLALRGPRPTAGFDGLRDAVIGDGKKESESRTRLLDWLAAVEKPMADFLEKMSSSKEQPFRTLLESHIRMAEDLATTLEQRGEERLWSREAGEAGSDFLRDLLAASDDVPEISSQYYSALLGRLLKTVTVRPRYGTHPRLSILGQIEARIFCADLVILGSLNEGAWPAEGRHDPWMSRPMRKKFGLPALEREIGLAAHDFVLAATSGEAVFTRARKVDGAPTVASRWLLRLDAVMKALGMAWKETPYRQWVKDMDAPEGETRPVARPSPCPPVSARPRKLSVTQIEKWMRDPYQIYAEEILNLKALDPIDADPGGAERGTFIHAALEKFVRAYPENIPPNAAEELLNLGRGAIEKMRVPREVVAFWWPRFEEIAKVFTEQDRVWRKSAQPIGVETKGIWTFDAPCGAFTLTAKADRIDLLANGGYAVIDYKSGAMPKKQDIMSGISPQLPLEAAMIEQGAFPDVPAGSAESLIHWRVAGSGEHPVSRESLPCENLAVEAETGLKALVAAFADEKTPYLSQPRESATPRYSDYTHLARVKEWGIAGEEGEE